MATLCKEKYNETVRLVIPPFSFSCELEGLKKSYLFQSALEPECHIKYEGYGS